MRVSGQVTLIASSLDSNLQENFRDYPLVPRGPRPAIWLMYTACFHRKLPPPFASSLGPRAVLMDVVVFFFSPLSRQFDALVLPLGLPPAPPFASSEE